MGQRSRFLLYAMSGAFGLSLAGIILGLIYSLYAAVLRHRNLEDILSHTIPFYQKVGLLGIAGFLLFLAFLISVAAEQGQGKKTK